MKIAIIGSDKPDSMESNLMEAFIHAGHNCQIFDVIRTRNKIISTMDKLFRTYSDIYDKNVFIKLSKKVNIYNPEFVVCVYRFIHPIFVEKVKLPNRKVIHINPDALTTFEYQQIFMSNYDVWFTKDPYIVHFMRDNMHLNAVYYNEAFSTHSQCNLHYTKQEIEQEVNIDVMTYGTMYPYRVNMLRQVIDAGIDLKVYGIIPHRFYNGELDNAYQYKYIVGEEKSKILYGSKIVFNQMHYAEIEGVNCRFFEVNGSGAFQISDYRPILHKLLPIDPELVSFKSIDEGINKIKYYLAHPDERYAIAEKVYKHFISNYTYDNLVAYIMEKTFN